MFAAVGRDISALAGVLLIYAGAFLYEDEDGRIQNLFETWWLRIDDLQRAALSRHTAFVREVARLVDRAFDQLFGAKLVSASAVAASTCYSIASIVVALRLGIGGHAESRVLWWALIFGGVGSARLFLRTSRAVRIWIAFVVMAVAAALWTQDIFFGFYYRFDPESGAMIREERNVALAFTVSMIGAVASDFFFIAWTRKRMRAAGHMPFSGTVGMVVGNASFALVLIAGPIVLADWLNPVDTVGIADVLDFIGESNLFTAAVAATFVVVALSLLLHRLMWPAISRPVYALERFRIVRQKKLLIAVGTACLGLASPRVGAVLREVLNL